MASQETITKRGGAESGKGEGEGECYSQVPRNLATWLRGGFSYIGKRGASSCECTNKKKKKFPRGKLEKKGKKKETPALAPIKGENVSRR